MRFPENHRAGACCSMLSTLGGSPFSARSMFHTQMKQKRAQQVYISFLCVLKQYGLYNTNIITRNHINKWYREHHSRDDRGHHHPALLTLTPDCRSHKHSALKGLQELQPLVPENILPSWKLGFNCRFPNRQNEGSCQILRAWIFFSLQQKSEQC